MNRRRAAPVGGRTTIIGAVGGLLITPVLWLAWYQEWLVPWLRNHLPPLGSVAEFVVSTAAYSSYGKVYCLALIGPAMGLTILARDRLSEAGRLEQVGLLTSLCGLIVIVIGCLVDYWLGWTFTFRESRPALHILIGVSYFVALASVLVGGVIYGLAIRRSTHHLAGNGRLFVLAGPAGLLLSVVHFPSGSMLLLNAAYLTLGRSLLAGEGAERPRAI